MDWKRLHNGPFKPTQFAMETQIHRFLSVAIQFLILYNYHISLFNKRNNQNEFIQELTCNICDDFITDAHLLYCGHIGCHICITQWMQQCSHTSTSTCPICRVGINYKPMQCKTIDIIIKYRRNHVCNICNNGIENNMYITCH